MQTVSGNISLHGVDERFRPDGIGWLRYHLFHFNEPTGARLRHRSRACLACGLVWSGLEPDDLIEFMRRQGIKTPLGEKVSEPE